MRKIKFRAWIVDEEKYYYNVQNTYDYIDWFNTGDEPAPYMCFGDMLNDENIILEQYTGLKDKNGVEICEGDIVEMDNYLYIIDYITNECAYRLRRAKNNTISMFTLQSFKTKFIEVIGNIHENGEFLK